MNIRVKDVDFDNKVVYVNVTKNRKPLVVPLNHTMVNILTEYLKYRDQGRYYTVDGTLCEFHYKSIEDAAWLDWYIKWGILRPAHTRPEPEKYVDAVRRPMKYF